MGRGTWSAAPRFVAILALINIRGLGESTKLNTVLALTDLMTRSRWSSGHHCHPRPGLMIRQVHLGVAPSYTQLLFAVSISMIAYTGIETVSIWPRRRRTPSEERLLGPTTRHVLAHRPCRFIVEHDAAAHEAEMSGNGAVPRDAVTAPKVLARD